MQRAQYIASAATDTGGVARQYRCTAHRTGACEYCKELGVEFVAGYYNPKNQALNPDIRTERPYPIVTVQQYLERAVEANAISLKLTIEEVVNDIRMLVIGNAFEWAMRNGEVDISTNMKRSISHYLDGVLL